MEQPLFFNMWLHWSDSPLTLAKKLGAFVTDIGLGTTYQGKKFTFTGLQNHNNEYVTVNPDHTEKQIQTLLHQNNVKRISLATPGQWQDPYILNVAVYRNWGLDVYVDLLTSKSTLVAVSIRFAESALWFTPENLAEKFFDKDHKTRSYKAQGWELKVSSETIPSSLATYGQMYIPEEKISRQNRTKVIEGLAKIIQTFAPLAATLTYWEPARYNNKKKSVSWGKEHGCIMYYLNNDETVVSCQTCDEQAFDSSIIATVKMNLEAEHFGYLAQRGEVL